MIERDYQEPLKVINLRIDTLKAELIGLTQQKDKLLGNPVADKMVVTVDVLPSVFSERFPIDSDAMTTKPEFDSRVEDDLTYDPYLANLARRTYRLSRDIR